MSRSRSAPKDITRRDGAPIWQREERTLPPLHPSGSFWRPVGRPASVPLALKDRALNRPRVERIASEVASQLPSFAAELFVEAAVSDLQSLELKARISFVAKALKAFLPADYREAVKVLVASVPQAEINRTDGSDFGSYIYAPHSEFVALFGRGEHNLEVSLGALKHFTKVYSAEDAIRYFINDYPARTMATLLSWTDDSDHRVRRLASEGTRPLLPWSQRISISFEEAVPILARLYTDSSRFVTRSVANHLNDVSRSDPASVIGILTRWQSANRQLRNEMQYIIRHATRTMVKQGYSDVFPLLGLSPSPAIDLVEFSLANSRLGAGEALVFELTIAAAKTERLIVDYIITEPGARGRTKRKVFKLKALQINRGASATLRKRHALGDRESRAPKTRDCRVDIQVNGRQIASADFSVALSGGTQTGTSDAQRVRLDSASEIGHQPLSPESPAS
jgi:3-methyladenine DNA glycosylase AlkC